MNPSCLLSPRANRSFRETDLRERFGVRQMRSCLDGLLDRCKAIAAGQVPHQSCRVLFADDLCEDRHFARVGQHFAIFVETPDAVLIVDFLNHSADIAGRLG